MKKISLFVLISFATASFASEVPVVKAEVPVASRFVYFSDKFAAAKEKVTAAATSAYEYTSAATVCGYKSVSGVVKAHPYYAGASAVVVVAAIVAYVASSDEEEAGF